MWIKEICKKVLYFVVITYELDYNGNIQYNISGKTHISSKKGKNMNSIIKQYDAKVDSKKRITLRDSKYEYYSVTTYEDGTISLEPRILVSKNDLALKKGYNAFLKLRENTEKNGTAGMSLDEINEVIYGEK